MCHPVVTHTSHTPEPFIAKVLFDYKDGRYIYNPIRGDINYCSSYVKIGEDWVPQIWNSTVYMPTSQSEFIDVFKPERSCSYEEVRMSRQFTHNNSKAIEFSGMLDHVEFLTSNNYSTHPHARDISGEQSFYGARNIEEVIDALS